LICVPDGGQQKKTSSETKYELFQGIPRRRDKAETLTGFPLIHMRTATEGADVQQLDWYESRLLDNLKFDLSEEQIDAAVKDSRRYAIPQAANLEYQLDVRQWELIGQLAGVRTIKEQITQPLPEIITAEHAATLASYSFGIGALCGKSRVPPYPYKIMRHLSSLAHKLKKFTAGKQEHPFNDLMLELYCRFTDSEGKEPKLNALIPLLTRQSGKGIINNYDYDADFPKETIFYCGKDQELEITYGSLQERFTKVRKKHKQQK
jgi:hypothetical protein